MAGVMHSFEASRVEQQRLNVLVRAAGAATVLGILDESLREVAQQYLMDHLGLDDLRDLSIVRVAAFLNNRTEELARRLAKASYKTEEDCWGPARQTVNLALAELSRRQVVYDFCQFKKFEVALEVPLDRWTMTFIQRETEERIGWKRVDLTPVEVSAMTPEVNECFQEAAQDIVDSENAERLWERDHLCRTDIDQYALATYLGEEADGCAD